MDSKMDSKIDSDFDNNFDNNDSIELISSSIRIRSESEELMINQNNPNVNIRTIDNVDIIPEKKITSYLEYALKFVLHILIHITLLSLAEPLLYFDYIAIIEKRVFFDQLKKFVKNIDPIFQSNNEEIRSALFYSLMVEYFKYENVDNSNYLNELQLQAEYDKIVNEKNNDELERKSFELFYILLGCTCFYYIMFQYLYRRKYFIFKILLKHLGLILFIGLYEIWFFQNVIIKYQPWSQNEITYYLMTCFSYHFLKFYPELDFTFNNTNLTC